MLPLLLDRIVRQGRAFGIHVLARFANARRRLHAGSHDDGTNGHSHRAAMQRSRRVSHHGRQQSRAALALASRRRNLQRCSWKYSGQQPVSSGLAFRMKSATRGSTKFASRRTRAEKIFPARLCLKAMLLRTCGKINFCKDLLSDRQIRLGHNRTRTRIWLGAPNSIKGPTEAVFQRQSGNNLLIVGQRDEAILAILSVAVISLVGTISAGTALRLFFSMAIRTAPRRATHLERVAQTHSSHRNCW